MAWDHAWLRRLHRQELLNFYVTPRDKINSFYFRSVNILLTLS